MLQAVMSTLEHGDKSLDSKQSFFSGIQFIPSAHMGHKIIRIWLKNWHRKILSRVKNLQTNMLNFVRKNL